MSNRYPLARLAELRALRATGAAIDLAEALAGETEAEADVARARAAVEAARTAARRFAVTPVTPSPAWSLAQREAYAIRLRREIDRALVRRSAAEADLAEWRATVASARDQAATARAEHQVVERHREAWQDADRKKRERRDD